MKELIILGAGENGVMVTDIIEKNNQISPDYNIIGYLDDDKSKLGKKIGGYEVLGSMDNWSKYKNCFFTSPLVSSPKNNHLKHVIVEKLNIPNQLYINIIPHELKLPKLFKMGVGNWIMPGAQINPCVELGNHNYISMNCVLGFGTIMEDYCNLSMTSVTLGNSQIKTGAYIGANASIFGKDNKWKDKNSKQNYIGRWSIVGMGSVVINAVNNYEIVAGNPSKVIGHNETAKNIFE